MCQADGRTPLDEMVEPVGMPPKTMQYTLRNGDQPPHLHTA
jgi:hypothetical protein